MNLQAIEYASRQAWPALQDLYLPFGVLRFARGVSRRANSFSMFIGARADLTQVRSVTEDFFQAHQLPAIVRVLGPSTTNGDDSLDIFLEQNNYELVTPTKVMLREIAAEIPAALQGTLPAMQVCDLDVWLTARYEILPKSANESVVQRAMLQRLLHTQRFLVQFNHEGRPICCGMAVCIDGLLGVFGVATASAYRNRGLARALVQQLLGWGKSAGARFAYLQVEASNSAALTVYEGLGFAQIYEYWYREKQFCNYNSRGMR